MHCLWGMDVSTLATVVTVLLPPSSGGNTWKGLSVALLGEDEYIIFYSFVVGS